MFAIICIYIPEPDTYDIHNVEYAQHKFNKTRIYDFLRMITFSIR